MISKRQALSALAGGTRHNLHRLAPEGFTAEMVGVGTPCTVSIGSDLYGGAVVEVRRRKSDGRITYVRTSALREQEFRLRKNGQLRSAGSGSYGLTLGYAESYRDPSF